MESPFKGKPDIRRYSIIPARMMQDDRVRLGHMKILACLGMYTNSHGICWPSQMRMVQHTGYARTSISRIIQQLIAMGYVRKLEPRDYPLGVRRRSARRVNRYQVLWEGNDKLPSREEFWAPKPMLVQDLEDDGVTPEVSHKKTGGLGDGNKDFHILAQAFKTTVERTCGLVRLVDPSLAAAQRLKNQGVTVEQVRDHTAAMVKDCLRSGRTPPANLEQVAQWAKLYK